MHPRQQAFETQQPILFAAPPLLGHANQLIVLAGELVAQGYPVHFSSGLVVRQQIEAAGAAFHEWDPETAIGDPLVRTAYCDLWRQVSDIPNVLQGEWRMYRVLADTYPAMFEAFEGTVSEIKPSIIIADSRALPAIDISLKQSIPCVVLAQFLGFDFPPPPSFPQFGTNYSIQMKWFQRILNRIQGLKLLAYLGGPLLRLEAHRKKVGIKVPIPRIKKHCFTMVATTFGIEVPRPLPPNVRMVGPILSPNPEPLPENIQNWFNESQTPVVLVSFGTLVSLSRKQLTMLVQALSSVNTRVLWGLREDHHSMLPQVPPSIRVEKWLPQQAVLAHHTVVAFVSHCGMNSISEAIHYAKPILAMPVFGDQHYNASRVVDLGLGLRVDIRSCTLEDTKLKLAELTSKVRFSEAAAKLSQIQQSYGGLRTALETVESVMHIGYSHLLEPK